MAVIDLAALKDIQDAKTQALQEMETKVAAGISEMDLAKVVDLEEIEEHKESMMDTGDTEVTRVSNEGNTQYNRVNTEGNTQYNRVKSEGNTQTGRVSDEGDSQYARINGLIHGAPTGGDALTLDGKTRTEFEADIQANTEQLQNFVQTLDDSLVAVISPEGISSNVLANNVFNAGSNVIDGEDVSFVKDDDGFYVGQGYENYIKKDTVFSSSSFTDISHNGHSAKATLLLANETPIYSELLSDTVLETDTTYRITAKVKTDAGNNITFRFRYQSVFIVATGTGQFEEISLEMTSPVTSGASFGIGLANGIAGDSYLEFKDLTITKTPNKVPFVPHSFKGGKLVIKEKIDEDTHSFIIRGNNFGKSSDGNFIKIRNKKGLRYYNGYTSELDGLDWIILISDSVQKIIFENGEEYNLLNDLTKTDDDYIHLSDTGTPGLVQTSFPYLKDCFIFKGNYTREIFENKLEIIKNGNYQLPPSMQGTILPIEGMVRRGDKYGLVQEVKKITDHSRDLWYADSEAMYEVIDNDLVTHMVRVNSDLTITGTALEDISGRLRVASAISLPAQIRKVR